MRIRLSSIISTVVLLALAGLAGGIVIIVGGWYNVAALDAHPRPFSILVHTVFKRSVAYYSSDIVAPDLSDPGMTNRAAGHYDAECAPCHGAPGVFRDSAGMGIYPRAPDLAKTAPEWAPAEMFWIIKYGAKLTGMPAWGPTHRDDEIWALVAFLKRLPEMSAEEYRRITTGTLGRDPGPAEPEPTGADIALSGVPLRGQTACARCHGVDGAGLPGGGIPRLSGQDADYLAATLEDYVTGFRQSGIMGPIAQALSPGQRRAAAAYYAEIAQAPALSVPVVGQDLLDLGATLASTGRPDIGIPACASCHGGPGSPPAPGMPAIAGQFADYMDLQFDLWRTGLRGAGPDGGIMQRIALTLSDREIEAVVAYYATLRGGTEHLALD